MVLQLIFGNTFCIDVNLQDRDCNIENKHFTLGGYTVGISFRGCIRNIERDYKPLDLKGTDFTSKDIQVGTCGLLDRYIIS